MKLDKFQSIIEQTPADVREHVKLSMDILDRIHELLEQKFEGKQKLLAEKMNKSEAEISRWLSGVQNFTTKTLIKLEVAFGEPIIKVCGNERNIIFQEIKAPRKIAHTKLVIAKNEPISKRAIPYEKVQPISIKNNIQSNLPA